MGGSEGDDPMFMQIKEASASVLESYLGASPYKNHGERVVIGQRMMQAASDILLGWSTFNGRDFYTRQLRDMKFSAEVETMNPKLFTYYVALCAGTLARAHARTGDPAQIGGYLGSQSSSTRPSPHSPRHMRIRLNGIMRVYLLPSKRGAFKPKLAFDGMCDIRTISWRAPHRFTRLLGVRLAPLPRPVGDPPGHRGG